MATPPRIEIDSLWCKRDDHAKVVRILAAPATATLSRVSYQDEVSKRVHATWLDRFLKVYHPVRSISRDEIVVRLRTAARDGQIVTMLPHEARALLYHLSRSDTESKRNDENKALRVTVAARYGLMPDATINEILSVIPIHANPAK